MEVAVPVRQFNSTLRPPSVAVTTGNGHHLSSSFVPFEWEVTPGTPKLHLPILQPKKPRSKDVDTDGPFDFAFEGSHRMIGGNNMTMATADELLNEGKIKPLKLPPRLEVVHVGCGTGSMSARWAKSTISSRLRAKVDDFDPFEKAITETISRSNSKGDNNAILVDGVTTASNVKDDNGKSRRLKDAGLLLKTTPESRTSLYPLGKDLVRAPSSSLRFCDEAVARQVTFSSFRSTYDDGPSCRLIPITGDASVWGSFRMVAPKGPNRRVILPCRRPLLRRLHLRSAIRHFFRKVFRS